MASGEDVERLALRTDWGESPEGVTNFQRELKKDRVVGGRSEGRSGAQQVR